jgi:hypothetical protein
MENQDKKPRPFSAVLDQKAAAAPYKPEFQRSPVPPVQIKPPRPHPALYMVVVVLFIALCVGAVVYRVARQKEDKQRSHTLPASMHMVVVEEQR